MTGTQTMRRPLVWILAAAAVALLGDDDGSGEAVGAAGAAETPLAG